VHGRFRDSDVLRHVFEMVVAQCIEAGLASGQRYAADASIIAADANRQKSTPKADWKPEAIDPNEAPRAVREYLDTLDDAAFGATSPVTPKFISHSDPASQWTGARGGPAYFAYSTNYLIDTDNTVILDVEPTRAIRQAEVGAVRTMIDQTKTKRYLARKSDCDQCALKDRCCPKEPKRKVTRPIYESSSDVARQLAQTTQYSISCKLGKKVEMSFAHLKRIHGLGRLRLRGPSGAHDEFILAATAQNPKPKKLAKLAPSQNRIEKAA
jgi:hypothetical protein